jgi:hypothetical protein
MRVAVSILLLLSALSLPARGHFIWIVPVGSGPGGLQAQVVFSESPEPGSAELMKKVTQTRVFARLKDGKRERVPYQLKGDAFALRVTGTAPRVLEATCDYGVLKRGDAEPFLLRYYARSALGRGSLALLRSPAAGLDLDIVLPHKARGKAQLLWKGKPVAEAEVIVDPPGVRKSTVTTDARGFFALPSGIKKGLYAIRARHISREAGERGGQAYQEARNYCTLTFAITEGEQAGKPQENPAASKLLADARAARATWENFSGFTAKLSVNSDGNIQKATVEVSKSGRVTLEGMEPGQTQIQVSRLLRSLVAHRLFQPPESATPCAFADQNKDHPLGRKIRVLNDELHSSYRIRDRQIIEVNRQMRDTRFTITVVENHVTLEKKFLPAHYVVNTWDSKTGALRSSVTHQDEWVRVQGFDLPRRVLIVTADSEGKLRSRELVFSGHALIPAASR